MRLSSLIFFFSFIFICINPSIAEARSFTIEQVDIHAYVLDNGDLYVEELFQYNFNGSYNGTTRTIGEDNHKGIEFFEGYLAPKNTKLARVDLKTLTPLKVEKEDLTFKIYTSSEDEEKKVFYRYLIKGAASKFKDTAQYYWRFFDDSNETDFHHVTIKISLYNDSASTLKGQVFLHDLTGGTLTKSGQEGIIYKNDFLPAGKTVEIRYLFPVAFLKNASFSKAEPMLSTFLEEERDYEKRLEIRSRWNIVVENVNLGITLLLLLFTIFYPQRISRLFRKGAVMTELENVDSFTLANLYRKCQLQYSDLISALFRLYQNGDLSIERVTARAEYLNDEKAPNFTYRFALRKEMTKLAEYEKELINWLFVKNEKDQWSFSLDQLPFPTESESAKNWRLEKEYKRKAKEFRRHFTKWRKTVGNDKSIQKYVRKNTLRGWLLKVGLPLWIALSLINSMMGMSDAFTVGLIGILLLFGFGIMLYKKNKRDSFPIYMAFGTFITYIFSKELSTSYLLVCGAFFVAAIFQPFYYITAYGTPYFKAMKDFRKEVSKGQFDFQKGTLATEKWFQHALSFNLLNELNYKYTNRFSSMTDELSPVFMMYSEESTYSYYYSLRKLHQQMDRDGDYSGSGSSGSSSSGGGGGAGAF